MLVGALPFLTKILSYLLLITFGVLAYLSGYVYLSLLFVGVFTGLIWLDWSDWRLKRFFSYDFFFTGQNLSNYDYDEVKMDLDVVLSKGGELRDLIHRIEKNELNKISLRSTMSEKSDLINLYKEIEVLLEDLNDFFWKYNGKTDLKNELGKSKYFIYISSFIYLYEAGGRLSKSSLLTVSLLSDKSETFKNLMRSLVFPSTQILVESGTYVLSNVKFKNKSISSKRDKFINEFKNFMEIKRFPVFASLKYYLSVAKLFRDQRLIPYFKRFLIKLSHTKIREGEMAMSLDNVSDVMKVLDPGDIILVRRATTMTAVVIPGYWTHAALYVGSKDELKEYFGVDSKDVISKFDKLGLVDDQSYIFEAVEKGVSASDHVTGLLADSIVAIKPKIGEFDRLKAVEFVLEHLKKDYDYGLDFFTEGSFVCSELVYKAYLDAETGDHKLGFEAKFKGGLVYTFSPQDMYESIMRNDDDKFEIGVCMKHDKKYKKVEKVEL